MSRRASTNRTRKGNSMREIAVLRFAVKGCLVLVAALALGSCGGGGSGDATRGGYGSALPSGDQKRGGTLTLLSADPFNHLDPGAAYSQVDYLITYATQRALYYFKPEDPKTPVPDIADGRPVVSADNRTVRVKLKRGIRYGTNEKTAVNGREVTAADVKYAFERAYNPSVPNGYVHFYFPLAGSANAMGGAISGITTPGRYTLELKLAKPFGATTARALSMPITIPVPKSYAAQFDAKQPNLYDTEPERQAFTGPYMIQSYAPDRGITLVRNPEWDPRTDQRPAYLDRIEWKIGVDPSVSGRQIFNGSGLANGDTAAPATVERFAKQAKDRISFTPSGNRFIAVNTQRKPFSDINVRKAFAAALNRRAMQLQRGGALVGDIASHFLPPAIPGFAEAGGFAGTGVDYLRKVTGDPAVAAAYMRKAGYASGKAGGASIVMVGANDSPAKETEQVMREALTTTLGFDVRLRLVDQGTYARLCGAVSQSKRIDVCANSGWIPDFIDPYAMLNPNFNGNAIQPVANNNVSLFNDRQINAAMERGALINDPAQRARAWGTIDRRLVAQVPAIPYFWDKVANVVSKNVHGVVARWNAAWDLAYMSLK
jgi:peptide/nickel transport system substrate-binding protein